MWDKIINEFILPPIQKCFEWLGQILDKIPGAEATLAFILGMYLVSRFIITPLIGGYIAADRTDFIDFVREKNSPFYRRHRKKGKKGG